MQCAVHALADHAVHCGLRRLRAGMLCLCSCYSVNLYVYCIGRWEGIGPSLYYSLPSSSPLTEQLYFVHIHVRTARSALHCTMLCGRPRADDSDGENRGRRVCSGRHLLLRTARRTHCAALSRTAPDRL